MGIVLNFHRHKLEEWRETGLYSCDRCGGAEGDLPKHCPGTYMAEEVRDLVMKDELDFVWPEGWTTITWGQRMRVKGMVT